MKRIFLSVYQSNEKIPYPLLCHPTNLVVCVECSRCGSPVTDSLETEIEQHGKVVILTEMDASCSAILIGTFSCGMLRLKHTWWPMINN